MKKDLNSLLAKRAARNGEVLDPEDVGPEPDENTLDEVLEGQGVEGTDGEDDVDEDTVDDAPVVDEE
jgi:hypothetical protein